MWTPKKLVDQEVLLCLSNLIFYLNQKTPDNEDVLKMYEVYDYDAAEEYIKSENYSIVEYDPGTWAAFAEGDAWTEEFAEHEDSDKQRVIEDTLDETLGSHITEHTSEVYEHWAVTSWLKSKLENQGEQVIEFCGLNVWCRCCTGQAIMMDHTFTEIAKELGWEPKHDCDFG